VRGYASKYSAGMMPDGARPAGGRPPGVPLTLEQRQWIERQWRSAGLTQKDVATRAGLGLKIISSIVNNLDRRYNPKSLAKIAVVVGISSEALSRRAFPAEVVARTEELEEIYAEGEDTYTDSLLKTMEPKHRGRGRR
jgi:transcriptional regulator with XRE-family HTH domain